MPWELQQEILCDNFVTSNQQSIFDRLERMAQQSRNHSQHRGAQEG
jgi:hypothetical protein